MLGKACPNMPYILFCFIKFSSYVYGLTEAVRWTMCTFVSLTPFENKDTSTLLSSAPNGVCVCVCVCVFFFFF